MKIKIYKIIILLYGPEIYYYSVGILLPSGLLSKNLKIKIYKITILLYGFETRSLILREKHMLRVFESRILRRTFRLERDENGKWKGLHNEELHILYHSPKIARVIISRRLRREFM